MAIARTPWLTSTISLAASGAVGNGTDESTLLQNFLDNLPPGTTAIVPPGVTYTLAQPIALGDDIAIYQYPNVTGGFKLANDDLTLRAFTTKSGNRKNIALANVSILGAGDGKPRGQSPGASGLHLNDVEGLVITNLRVAKVGGVGCIIQGVRRFFLQRINISQTGRGALVLWGLGYGLEDGYIGGLKVFSPGDDGLAIQASHGSPGRLNGVLNYYDTQAGSAIVTIGNSGTANLDASLIGQPINIANAGGNDESGNTMPHETSIAAVINNSTMILATPALKTVTNSAGYYNYRRARNVTVENIFVVGRNEVLADNYGRSILFEGCENMTLNRAVLYNAVSSNLYIVREFEQTGEDLWSRNIVANDIRLYNAGQYQHPTLNQPKDNIRINGAYNVRLNQIVSVNPGGVDYVDVAGFNNVAA